MSGFTFNSLDLLSHSFRYIVQTIMRQSSECHSPQQSRYNALSRRHINSSPATKSPRRLQSLFPPRSSVSDLVLAPGNLPKSSLVPTMLYSMSETMDSAQNSDSPTISALVQSSTSMPDIRSQQAQLDKESHANRLKLQDRIKQEKSTEATYRRQWNRYDAWWKKDQQRRVVEASQKGLVWIPEDSHPITALKVALYMQYEATRPKLAPDGSEIEGTQPGVSAVKQIVNALEYYRSHLQHEDTYRQCPDSHKPLRDDLRISQFEDAAGVTETDRESQMQIRKADGLQSETFTPQQLTQASVYYLQPKQGTTPTQIKNLIRDRSMLLATTTMAFRGDNVRRLKWSDIFIRETLLPDIGPDFTVPTLVVVTNKGKENSSGRLDEHGAFRHRLPEHCGIGSLALYFFTMFHVSNMEVPDFAPDYSNPSLKGMGYRKWYQRLMYPGKDNYTPMSLDNHIRRVNKMKRDTGIDIGKVTHAGRGFTVKAAREAGASVEGAMALGVWMAAAGGSFAPVYDRALPVDAMLGAAGFNAHRQQSYFVSRSVLDPPPDMITKIYPWIEAEEAAYNQRVQTSGDKARDGGFLAFMKLLRWLRVVLLQDAAVLYAKYPDASIFQYDPFNSPEFRKFSSDATTIISDAELAAQVRLQHLPEEAAEATRGMFTTLAMKQDIAQKSMEMTHTRMDQNIDDMRTTFVAVMSSVLPSKKRKALEAALSIPPVRPAPVQPVSRQQSFSNQRQPTSDMDDRGTSLSSPTNQSNAGNLLASFHFADVVTAPSPTRTSSPLASPTPNVENASTESPSDSPDTLSAHAPVRTVSRAGNVYGYSTFELSDIPTLRSKQLDVLSALEATFSYERLLKHEFEWDAKFEDWIPKFSRFWTPPGNQKLTIEDVWREDKFGINGMFSLQELNAKWDARWRRNLKPLKSEYSRRHKIVILIEKLSAKPNWNFDLAFRFLHEMFPTQTVSARTLSDYLIPQEKVMNEIIHASGSYP